MFKNYLKIALRNLWINKGFSAINIIGLATGLAVCLLIVLYVLDELSYDRYNKNADRIYRLDADLFFNNTHFSGATSPEPLAAILLKDYPQVEQIVRFNYQGPMLVKKGSQNIEDHHAVFADSTFFKVFTLPMVEGNPSTALKEPNSIVIDETTAKKYFNRTDVIGRTLYVNNSTNCKITGVIKDIPRQSHFQFSFIRPLTDTSSGNPNDWINNNNDQSYILVKRGITQASMQRLIDATVNSYLSNQLQLMFHTSLQDLQNKGNYFHYYLMPLTDIHLHSDKSYELEANGSVTYVYIFSVIALLILIIACINFMNLSTARSANRAKEVGVRKVAGSLRSHLISQFLTESVLLSFFSLFVAISIAALLLPLFNQLAGKQMSVGTLFSSKLLPVLVTLVLVVGILAGSYPAFYLSSFQPTAVLKGKIAKGFKSSWLRSSLVVFQFTISIILIIGTMVIYDQLDYIRNRNIGYNRNEVLVLHNTTPLADHTTIFREELLKIPGVRNVTVSSDLPTSDGFYQNAWYRDATMHATKAIIITNFFIDENYVPTLGMEIMEGRNFSRDYPSDSAGLILNETAVKLLGYKDPLKEKLYYPDQNYKPLAFNIIGVVKNFNFSSMHDKVGPLVMQLGGDKGSIAVRINTKNIPSLISSLQSEWNQMASGQFFRYTFMDNDFNNIYHAEQRTGKLFMTFAVFAIFIGCLGLFGLVTYAAEQRTKEIGVRKVLGATVTGIVAMLSKDFAKLVLIASIIAFPVAWWTMNKWLQSFAYRVHISWCIFVIAGAIAVVIALITVSLQAIKAAITNPVVSLRAE